MISALSLSPDPLAPKPVAPAIGDPAAFGALLAGIGGMAAVVRQTAAPTGKAAPPLDLLAPPPGPPIGPVPEPERSSRDPAVAPSVAPSPKLVAATPKPAAWSRFVRAETGADPDRSVAADEVDPSPTASSGPAVMDAYLTQEAAAMPVPSPVTPTMAQVVALPSQPGPVVGDAAARPTAPDAPTGLAVDATATAAVVAKPSEAPAPATTTAPSSDPASPGGSAGTSSALPSTSTPERTIVVPTSMTARSALASTDQAVPTSAPTATGPDPAPSFKDGRADGRDPSASAHVSAASTPVATGAPAAATRAVASGPARQVFAADLRRAARDPRVVAGEAFAGTPEAVRLDAAASATASAGPPIDVRQDHWPSAMVDRIERLRDAAKAADTRIRLIPDALGVVDVAVQRDGDTVHVRFSAEQAATRSLLQDAAPRLAEAAEARGVKLGQTSVGDGGSQPNGRQPQQPSAPTPARPRSAAASSEDATDTRIA